jgi:anti-sigma factor NepR-like protein
MVKAKRESRGAPKKKGETMQIAAGQSPEDGAGPRIDARIQREIGKHLRAHYIDVVNEPVPDRLMDLLEKLEQSVTRKKT